MISPEQSWSLSPIVIGIVGHTRLRSQDVDILSQRVRGILENLCQDYPHTPVVVVSSLAEGADQICAGIALELGLEVIAPLPFPPELYATRFANPEARSKLAALVQNPRVRAFCPMDSEQEPIDFKRLIEDNTLRKERYADVAVFVARHAHALIALCDGDNEVKTSLTAELIAFKTLGRFPSAVDPIKSPPELGIVYNIFTPRPEWVPETKRTPGDLHILPALLANGGGAHQQRDPKKLFEKTCELTEILNREIAGSPQPAGNDLLKSVKDSTATENNLAGFRRRVANVGYIYKDRIDRAYVIVFGFVFIGALLLHSYGHITRPESECLYPALFLSSLGFFMFAWLYPALFHTHHDEQRRLDYRALVEALRVQCYWHYAGLKEWVPDHYLQRQRSELDWIRQSTRAWALRLQAENHRIPSHSRERLEAVVNLWLKEQADFYEKSHRKNEAAHLLWRRISVFFAVVSLGLAVLLLWPLSLSHPPHHPVPYLVILSTTLLAAAMALAYGEKRMFAEHARHFSGMGNLFRGVEIQCRQLLETGRYSAVNALLEQMGKEALAENTDWLILHRVRHFEVPPAG